MSYTTDEDIFSFTDELSDSGPLTYISSLTIMDEEDEIVEEYPELDMRGEFSVYLGHNLFDVTTEDVKQFVVIHAFKQISVFQEPVSIESDNETLKYNSDKWVLSKNSDGLDSDDEEFNDSGFESDENIGEG